MKDQSLQLDTTKAQRHCGMVIFLPYTLQVNQSHHHSRYSHLFPFYTASLESFEDSSKINAGIKKNMLIIWSVLSLHESSDGKSFRGEI